MIKITLRTWAQVPFLVLTIAGMAGAQSYPNGSLIEENHSGDNGGFQSDYGTYANFEYSLYDNLVFKNNTAQGVGGAFALSGGGGLFFTNNNSIVFSNNMGVAGGGALAVARGPFNFKSNQEVLFLNNRTEDLGGAVYVIEGTGFLFDGNGKVVFDGNTSARTGGAIGSGGGTIISFTNNNEVIFTNNSAGLHGGAIGYGAYLFENNSVIHFDNNSAKGAGGAIFAYGGLIFSKNDSLIFSNNSAGVLGSAVIATMNITIVDCGDVLFTDNKTGGNGAALYVSASLENLLSADRGNIIFSGNYSNTNGVQRRMGAWFASNNVWAGTGRTPSLNIRAAKGRSVEFHDALWVTNTEGRDYAPMDVDFNKGEGYGGTILFSGQQNGGLALESVISGNTTVHQGILSIRDQAQVSLYEMKNDGGGGTTSNKGNRYNFSLLDVELFEMIKNGKLVAGTVSAKADTVLRFGTGAGIDATTLDLRNGATFDLKPFYDSMESGAIVKADHWSLGGSITLHDSLSEYVDNRWMEKKEYMLFFDENDSRGDQMFDSIKTQATGTNVVDTPYTFNGYWTYEWQAGSLYAIWNPTGGVTDVAPELEGNIVSNSLSSTASNMHTMARAALGNVDIFRIQSEVKRNIWAKGVGDFSSSKSMGDIDGYQYQGGGYVVGADYLVGEKAIFGAAFGEMFGSNKSDLYDARISQRTLMLSAYGAKLQEFSSHQDQSILWTWLASMGNTMNNLKTRYSDGESSQGKWDSTAYYLEGKATWRIETEGKRWVYTPFMGLEFTHVSFVDFTEEGDKVRRFSDGDYANLSLPIGIGAEYHSTLYKKPWLNVFQVSYVPDIYRNNPVSNAQRLSTEYEWRDIGVKASKHAVRASINSTLKLNNYWTTYAGYTFEGRGASIYHNVHAGVSYSF